MKIVIPGGSGQVGTMLARQFQHDGHEVVVLSRRSLAKPWKVIQWDGQSFRVKLRSAMIMSPDADGVFDVLLRLTRLGVGGTVGDGRQFVSWIHEVDFINALYWLIEHEEVDGVINVASPNPLPNAHFMRALRQASGMHVGLPSTHWMLEIGAFLLRTESELLLKSRRVVPGRLLEVGFAFTYPQWAQACAELVQRQRSIRGRSRAAAPNAVQTRPI